MAARVLWQPFFYLPEEWNGMDEHLLLLARHIDRSEWDLVLAQTATDGPQTETLARRADLPLVRLPDPSCGHGALRRFYKDVRADVVHMHTPVVGGQARFALAARLEGSRSMLTVHQIQPGRLPVRGRMTNRAAAHFLLGPILAVSSDVRQTMAQNSGIPAARVAVVPNGIDDPGGEPAATLQDDSDAMRLGYFGRLSPEKGVDLLIEGLALVAAEGRRFTALIAGDGPERERLEALARHRGLGGSVRFLGFLDGATSLMASVDIVVHTPRYEGFGLAVLEAMALGKPVVVTPAPGGIPEMVVDGETGFVARAIDARSIADALLATLDERSRSRAMGAAGYQRFRDHFRAETMAHRTVAHYRRALGQQRSVHETGALAPREG